MIEGSLGIEVAAAIGKGVRGDGENAHDYGAFAKLEGAGADLPFEDGAHGEMVTQWGVVSTRRRPAVRLDSRGRPSLRGSRWSAWAPALPHPSAFEPQIPRAPRLRLPRLGMTGKSRFGAIGHD